MFFVLGAIIASFVGVLVARLHTGQGFLTGRSRCDACDTPLTYISLIPIASYLIGNGRARCCGARVSAYAPVAELLLGTLFVLAYTVLGFTPALPLFLLSLSILLALVLYDLFHQILPSLLLVAFVITCTATSILSSSQALFFSNLLTAFFIALPLILIHFFSRGRAMGFADAPLAFGLALLTGPNALSGFVFSFWVGAVIGVALLYRRPVGSRMGVEVPFAPFLAVGFLLAYFTQWNLFTFVAASL